MTDPTPREVETACFCAGSPHQRDHFVLPAELPITAGIAAVSALAQAGSGDAAAALINAILVNGGIKEWNLVDEEGQPLPLNPTNVTQRVTWTKGGVELSNAAFAQYVNGKDLAPFGLTSSRKRTAASSPNGQTASSTSPKTSSSRKRRAPSA